MTARRVLWRLLAGESSEVLRSFRAQSFDALVTDPPSGMAYMGRDWDTARDRQHFIELVQAVFEQCFRVLKPGAYGMVWALPRLSPWTVTALENAGFEIRDRISHLFGTGFPKGTNKAKIPAEWFGWNTALKPGGEDWWLIRRPMAGTLAANLLEHGTGALNIDGCRLGDVDTRAPRNTKGEGFNYSEGAICGSELGRWPANVVLDELAAAELDHQAGIRKSKGDPRRPLERQGFGFEGRGRATSGAARGDAGGASRFFFTPKPSRAERDTGCDHLEAKAGGEATGRKEGSAGTKNPRAGANRGGGAKNHHPTVKAQSLMRWLVRLVTPPGGLVLDPFTGSGSTGCAVIAEGGRFVGIEREPEYSVIARARLAHAVSELAQ